MKTRQLLFLTIFILNVFLNTCYAQVTQPTNAVTNANSFIGTSNSFDVIFKRENIFSGSISLNNTSFGNNAFSSNVNGIYNVAIGSRALKLNTSGQLNVAIGYEALSQSTTSGENIAVGSYSMGLNTTGNYNVALGHRALNYNTTGIHNVAIGNQALMTGLNSNYNVAIGSYSGFGGSYNISLGIHSGENTTGSNNISLGNTTAAYNGNRNILIGDNIRLSNLTTYPQNSFLDIGNVLFGTNMYNWDSNNNGTTYKQGRIGINVNNPNNTFEIKSEGSNLSGLRFTNLKSNYLPSTSSNKFLTVDASGDVILQNLPVETDNSAWKLGGNALTALQNIGTTTAFDLPFITGNATGSSEKMRLTKTTGRLGIGTNAPTTRLQITSEILNDSGLRFTNLTSAFAPGSTATKFLTVNASGVVVLQNLPAGSSGTVSIANGINTTVTGTGVSPSPYVINAKNIYTDNGSLTGTRTVTMGNNNLIFSSNGSASGNGRVYIGDTALFPAITATSNYRLLVEGGILSERVKVALRNPATNWADYVFADDYKLKPLKEVEAYINENNHLPGIDSANELVKNGLDLGEMQAKQMGKIEELTLYAIEQNKKLENQDKEIKELKAQVKLLIEKNK